MHGGLQSNCTRAPQILKGSENIAIAVLVVSYSYHEVKSPIIHAHPYIIPTRWTECKTVYVCRGGACRGTK